MNFFYLVKGHHLSHARYLHHCLVKEAAVQKEVRTFRSVICPSRACWCLGPSASQETYRLCNASSFMQAVFDVLQGDKGSCSCAGIGTYVYRVLLSFSHLAVGFILRSIQRIVRLASRTPTIMRTTQSSTSKTLRTSAIEPSLILVSIASPLNFPLS